MLYLGLDLDENAISWRLPVPRHLLGGARGPFSVEIGITDSNSALQIFRHCDIKRFYWKSDIFQDNV